MKKPTCPYCRYIQTNEPQKTWTYGKLIIKKTKKATLWGDSVICSRYQCKCGRFFNYYKGRTSSWTIPKSR